MMRKWLFLCFLNLGLIALVCCVQNFTVKPSDTAVIRGQTAILYCSVANRVGMIQWAKDGFLLGFDKDIPGFPTYSIIQDKPEDYNLQITDTTMRDDAEYECQVGPAPGQPILQAAAYLTIIVPPDLPEIIGHSNGTIVDIPYTEHLINLTCLVRNGRPAATIQWFRNNQLVTEGVQNSTEPIVGDKRENSRSIIMIRQGNGRQEQGSVYKCSAKNAALTQPVEVQVQLNILYPPSQPEITGYADGQKVRAGDTLRLVCISRGGNPPAQVVWYRNDEKIDFSYDSGNNRSENELIFTAEKLDNNAFYRCEASNPVTTRPLTRQVQLKVFFPPSKVTISGNKLAKAGQDIVLKCESTNSNPAAVITWFSRGRQIAGTRNEVTDSDNGGFITSSEITVTLSGQENNVVYTCQATNTEVADTVADTVTLSVLYPPGPPEISGYSENDIVKAGDLQRMSCISIGGNPPATLKWFKGNEEISSDSSTVGSMVTADVAIVTEPSDNNAIYKCTASNEATSVPLETLVKLTIYFKPESVNVTAFPEIGKAGEELTLTCITASSNPAASVTWVSRNEHWAGRNMGTSPSVNGGMTTTNVLKIIPNHLDNEALYRCEAKNLLLQESANDGITLNVLYKPVFNKSSSPSNIEITEGESMVVNYSASANPNAVTYSLFKDGMEVFHFSIDRGVLKINSAHRDNSGLYSLKAANSEGSSSYNFTVNVLYPAEIESITSPVAVDEDGTAVFECVAKANPIVNNMVVWTRPGFDMSKTTQNYNEGKSVLKVFELKRADTGTFTCTAYNRVGDQTVREAQLIVKFAPVIDKSPQFAKSAGDEGSTARMICKADGAPNIDFKWTREGYDVTGDKYQVMNDKPDTITYQSILTVNDVTKAEYGTYMCKASNEKGEDTFSISLDGTSIPDLPYDVTFVNATHDSITISWKPGFNGGLDQWYIVRYKAANSQEHTFMEIKNAQRTVKQIIGLKKGTTYMIAVFSENIKGRAEETPSEITCKTSDTPPDEQSLITGTDDTPVIVIMVVCVVGIFLLALNIGLILFFVRKRKKRLENNSDTTSHTNTIELYGPSKETALYPMPNHDDRSYGTYEKNMDDLSDDFRNYEHGDEKSMHSSSCNCNCYQMTKSGHKTHCCLPPDSSGDEDIKRVFLPPPGYSSYAGSKMDSPELDHRQTYIPNDYLDDPDRPPSQWRYEDPYRIGPLKSKGTFDSDYPDDVDRSSATLIYNDYGAPETRPKSVTDYSDRSSSRGGGGRTPPPAPPVRSSSKGAANHYLQSQGPPIPDRNYDIDDLPPPNYNPSPQPRYGPPPGSLGSFSGSTNIVTNHNYDGPQMRPSSSSPRTHQIAGDEMRGHLV